MKEASRMLEKGARYLPSLEELAARLESTRLELEDIDAEVAKLSSRTEAR